MDIQGGPKNGYPVLFWDNFGNSAPILTILSLCLLYTSDAADE